MLLPMPRVSTSSPLLMTCCSTAGTSLTACSSSVLRMMAHIQLLAATQTLTNAGFSSSYGAAAQQLEWSMLNWVPQSVNSFGLGVATWQEAGTGQLLVEPVRP